MSVLQSLDNFVHATRLDALSPPGGRRRRRFRWLPAAALAGLVIGYVLIAAAGRGAVSMQAAMVGGLAFVSGSIAATVLRLFGPRLERDETGALDERELGVRARAGSLAGMIVTWLVILFCFYAALASAFGAWLPVGPVEWVLLGLMLQAAASVLPVLVASWLEPAADEDE